MNDDDVISFQRMTYKNQYKIVPEIKVHRRDFEFLTKKLHRNHFENKRKYLVIQFILNWRKLFRIELLLLPVVCED